MSEEIDMTKIEKMVEKGFKELYDKKKQKRETAFADGVRFANLQMWYILKEQENEIERLNKELEEYKKDFKEANDLALKLITNNQEYVCKSIKDTIDILIEKLQQKENIIKEVREYLNENDLWNIHNDYANWVLLKILDKVGDEE